jgi:hypothetical protein
MPVWLQVALPIFTALLGGSVVFGFGRLNKAMDRRQEQKDAETAKAEVEQSRRPAFSIEHMSGVLYRLVNTGNAEATGVRFTGDEEDLQLVGDRPEGIALGLHAGHEFYIASVEELPQPTRILVMCDQFETPTAVRVSR